MTRVAIFRPEPGASATLERARRLGLDAFALPLFAIETVDWQAPGPGEFDGLLITSANAIREGGAGLGALRGLPVFAVGKASSDAARDAGFGVAAAGDAGVDKLLGSIDPALRLLHLTGEDRIAPTAARQAITAIIVYRSKEIANVDWSQVGRCVALIHSPRAGRHFAERMVDRSQIAIAAISAAAAEAAGGGWAGIAVADAPNDEALLALAQRLCNSLALS